MGEQKIILLTFPGAESYQIAKQLSDITAEYRKEHNIRFIITPKAVEAITKKELIELLERLKKEGD